MTEPLNYKRRSHWSRSVLGVHWKDWCWSWDSNTLATSCRELTHLKRPWCWERLKAGEGDNRGWDGWIASPTPKACSNSCPLSRWCHPTSSSSVIHFSCLQSFPASGSFQMSQLFTSGGQSIGASASTSVLPMNTQDWSTLGWTGWVSLQSKELSRIFSNTTRDLFKKVRDTKGTFYAKVGLIKDRNCMDLTEAEDIKKRR